MKTEGLCLFILPITINLAWSQKLEVVAPAGAYHTNGSSSISLTIGEPLIYSHNRSQLILTEGLKLKQYGPSIGHLQF